MKEMEIIKEFCFGNYGDEKTEEIIKRELGEYSDVEISNDIAKIMQEEIFGFIKGKAKHFDEGKIASSWAVIVLCDYVSDAAFLHKRRDYKKIHKQMIATIAPIDYFNFLITYRRFVKRYDRTEQKNFLGEYQNTEGYIPDSIVKKGYEAVDDFYYAFEIAMDRAEADNAVPEIYEELKDLEWQGECNGKKYIIKIPKKASEIIMEAKEMQNCIASRLPEYVNKQWIYGFCRDAESENAPLFDIIIHRKSGKPTWIITKGHINVEGDNREAFDIWWNEKLPLINEICGKKAVGF